MLNRPKIWLILELIKPRFFLAFQALGLAVSASLLEGVWASLALPLLQILGNPSTSTNPQLPQALQNLTSFYTRFTDQWHLPVDGGREDGKICLSIRAGAGKGTCPQFFIEVRARTCAIYPDVS